MPEMLDILHPCYGVESGLLKKGDIVKTINKHGCPKFGTMGQGYIEKDGKFLGMVSLNSLQEID
jgi:hypothetical protein